MKSDNPFDILRPGESLIAILLPWRYPTPEGYIEQPYERAPNDVHHGRYGRVVVEERGK